jgi:TPP-dependent pyruvate/acetoin dehydrogenase alpha subunit
MKEFRSPNYNIRKSNFSNIDLEILKKIFAKMSKIRFYELEAYENRKNKKFETLIYLCLGQESVYASVSQALPKASIFGQHRGHGIYLSYGGNPVKLTDELIGLKSGTNKGMGGSPPIFDRKIGMFGHVGLIGDQVPVAAGYSLINKKKTTITFFGDGAAEEDYVLATFGFAKQYKLNLLFICDDNDLSVLTKTDQRRKWSLSNVASSFGIQSIDITDDPLTIYHSIKKIKNNLPALINIRTCREYWHEGAGNDKPDELAWNRYLITKNILLNQNLNTFVDKIENKNKKWAKNLWKKRLQKL